jgi:hypothetical protein
MKITLALSQFQQFWAAASTPTTTPVEQKQVRFECHGHNFRVNVFRDFPLVMPERANVFERSGKLWKDAYGKTTTGYTCKDGTVVQTQVIRAKFGKDEETGQRIQKLWLAKSECGKVPASKLPLKTIPVVDENFEDKEVRHLIICKKNKLDEVTMVRDIVLDVHINSEHVGALEYRGDGFMICSETENTAKNFKNVIGVNPFNVVDVTEQGILDDAASDHF